MTTFLLVLHAASAVVLIGAATHNAILSVQLLRGRRIRRRLQRLYVRIVFWAYVPTSILGLIIYPAFRINVRAARFDSELPLATGFFEVKEHWVALGLFVLLAYLPLSRRLDVRERSPDRLLYGLLGVVVGVIVWMAMWTGLTLTAIEPI